MKKTVCTILAAAMSICVYTNAYASDYTQPDIEYVQSESVQYSLDFNFTETSGTNAGISTIGLKDEAREELPSYMFGAYNASDGIHYLQINSGVDIDFRGTDVNGKEIFCDSRYLTNIYFNVNTSRSDNFSLTYSKYAWITSRGAELKNDSVIISGKYDKQSKSITIFQIKYKKA